MRRRLQGRATASFGPTCCSSETVPADLPARRSSSESRVDRTPLTQVVRGRRRQRVDVAARSSGRPFAPGS